MSPVVLAEPEWQARRERHRARMARWTVPHRQRRRDGLKHPVLDFLFSYYSHRPAQLERWHPGAGVVLAGPSAREYLNRPHYTQTDAGVTLDLTTLTESRRTTARFVAGLVSATASRTPRLNCFGQHEWAMVYRASADEIRHAAWPLRLGRAGTDTVVESRPVRCSHFDAFRFFAPAARPLNTLGPSRDRQRELEQPGCLHANMDLFKWCYKLAPLVPSELVADCFELAVRIRELDMRASPYDLSALGYPPVRIETAEGRAEYAREQARFAAEAAPLRARLLDVCADLLE